MSKSSWWLPFARMAAAAALLVHRHLQSKLALLVLLHTSARTVSCKHVASAAEQQLLNSGGECCS
jgi:uncharacterized protein with von Willebrand factor type A (vWA) domain